MTNDEKVEEIVKRFHSSKKKIPDYCKLRLKVYGVTKDIYSSLSAEECYSVAQNRGLLSIKDIQYLNQLFEYNPCLKLKEEEILKWVLRGLTAEESVIRAQLFLIQTVAKYWK